MQRLITPALILVLSLYALTGLFMRVEVDSYCDLALTAGQTPADYLEGQYATWSGRYGYSLTNYTLNAVLGDHAPAIMPAAFIVAMVAAWWYLLKPLMANAFRTALALTLAFLIGVPNIWQSLFWLSASINYVIPIIGCLWLVGFLLRRGALQPRSYWRGLAKPGDSSNS